MNTSATHTNHSEPHMSSENQDIHNCIETDNEDTIARQAALEASQIRVPASKPNP